MCTNAVSKNYQVSKFCLQDHRMATNMATSMQPCCQFNHSWTTIPRLQEECNDDSWIFVLTFLKSRISCDDICYLHYYFDDKQFPKYTKLLKFCLRDHRTANLSFGHFVQLYHWLAYMRYRLTCVTRGRAYIVYGRCIRYKAYSSDPQANASQGPADDIPITGPGRCRHRFSIPWSNTGRSSAKK